MRRVLRSVTAALLAGVVGACSLHSGSQADGKSGTFTLVWGKETDPAGINPLKAGDVHAWEIFTLGYEPLTQPDKNMTAGADLAESWKQLSNTA